jgi:hypothetical protein
MVDWSLSIADIVNIVFILVILWEVILLKKNSKAGVWQDSVNKLLEMDRLVITNENLQPVFDEDFPEEEENELTSAQQRYILYYLTCMEQLYVNKSMLQSLLSRNKLWKPWESHIKSVLSLPAFQKVWKELGDQHEFIEDFEKAANKFTECSK